jgi:hypothetical protein
MYRYLPNKQRIKVLVEYEILKIMQILDHFSVQQVRSGLVRKNLHADPDTQCYFDKKKVGHFSLLNPHLDSLELPPAVFRIRDILV